MDAAETRFPFPDSGCHQSRMMQYRIMVRSVIVTDLPEEIKALDRIATNVRHMLKRHDRIIWWLRLFQRNSLENQARGNSTHAMTVARRRRHRRLVHQLGHLDPKVGQDLPEIEFMVVWSKASKLAQKVPLLRGWLDRLQFSQFKHFAHARVKVQSLHDDALKFQAHQHLVEDFITFPNGWKWVLSLYSGSEWEGRFMRHCGNMGAKDRYSRLLSLREPVKTGSLTIWKPHLTFTFSMSCIGEMKGYANSKPSPCYYPYIRELFLHDRVTRLSSQLGALPEHDLAWTDLPETIRRDVENKRHWLFHYGRTMALENYLNPPPPPPPPPEPTHWDIFRERVRGVVVVILLFVPILPPAGYFLYIVTCGLIRKYGG